jgi:tetratricopeptide (TPR) repeat protein
MRTSRFAAAALAVLCVPAAAFAQRPAVIGPVFNETFLDAHALARMSDRGEGEQARREQEQAQRERESTLYAEAQELLDAGRWDQAARRFAQLAEANGARTDAALYWQAYSQNRLGQRAEALQTIAGLLKTYPNSRYVQQARALDVEVRRDAGQPVRPEAQTDEELKLMALLVLQNSNPGQAVPMLETVLQGSASPRLKERALFVLAQSPSPRAPCLRGWRAAPQFQTFRERAIQSRSSRRCSPAATRHR